MQKKLLALLMVVFLAAATFVGCTKKDGAAGGDTGKMEAYLEKEGATIKSQMDAMSGSLGDGGSIDVAGKDNELIYTFKFGSDIPTEGMETALLEGLDAQATVFESLAEQLKTEVKLEKAKVTVKYVGGDDKELATKTFESK